MSDHGAHCAQERRDEPAAGDTVVAVRCPHYLYPLRYERLESG